MLDLEKLTRADYYFSRNEFIIKKLDSLHYGENLHAIKPFEILCDSKYCPAISNGEALYFDDDHLSIVGASKLTKNSIIGKQLYNPYLKILKQNRDVTLEVNAEELKQAKFLTYCHNIEDIESCNIYIVTVPTPIDKYKRPNLTSLKIASKSVGKIIKNE